MKNWIVFILIMLCSNEVLFAQSSYVKKYRPLADSLSDVYQIPASVILGIAVLESSSGQSRNAKLLNNHFGIEGTNNLIKSHGIKSRYKQYRHPRESYIDLCGLISRKKFYNKLKGKKNEKEWVEALSQSGYSEQPLIWKKRVMNIIKKNKL